MTHSVQATQIAAVIIPAVWLSLWPSKWSHFKLCWWDYAYWIEGLFLPLNLFCDSVPSDVWYFTFEHRVIIRSRQIVWRRKQNEKVRLDYKFLSFHVGSCSTVNRSVCCYNVLYILFLLTMDKETFYTLQKPKRYLAWDFKFWQQWLHHVEYLVHPKRRIKPNVQYGAETQKISSRRFKVLSVVFVKNAFYGHVSPCDLV